MRVLVQLLPMRFGTLVCDGNTGICVTTSDCSWRKEVTWQVIYLLVSTCSRSRAGPAGTAQPLDQSILVPRANRASTA